jgi:hypothetical protein
MDHSLHRIGIESESKQLHKIITQTDVVKFIRSHLGEAADLTVEQLKLGRRSDIVKIDKSIVALEAFKLMNQRVCGTF